MTPRELAVRLKMNVVTLAGWRVAGKGPRFVKLGRKVMYPYAEVAAWELERLRQNTSGLPPQPNKGPASALGNRQTRASRPGGSSGTRQGS